MAFRKRSFSMQSGNSIPSNRRICQVANRLDLFRGDDKQISFCVNEVIGRLQLDFSKSFIVTYELVSNLMKMVNHISLRRRFS